MKQMFECLGIVKTIVESDIFSQANDQDFLRHLLLTYDLPSSLEICKLLMNDQSAENSQRIKLMAERALTIDPENPEAKRFL